jgi:hypothetical protein
MVKKVKGINGPTDFSEYSDKKEKVCCVGCAWSGECRGFKERAQKAPVVFSRDLCPAVN